MSNERDYKCWEADFLQPPKAIASLLAIAVGVLAYYGLPYLSDGFSASSISHNVCTESNSLWRLFQDNECLVPTPSSLDASLIEVHRFGVLRTSSPVSSVSQFDRWLLAGYCIAIVYGLIALRQYSAANMAKACGAVIIYWLPLAAAFAQTETTLVGGVSFLSLLAIPFALIVRADFILRRSEIIKHCLLEQLRHGRATTEAQARQEVMNSANQVLHSKLTSA